MAWFNPRFIINRIVDVMFCLDALLEFFIAYEEKKHHEDEGGGDAVPWVVDHRRIALNYCRTWLLFDVVTIGVSAFDIAPTFQALRTSASQVFAARVAVGGSDGLNLDASNLTILRVLRTLRLIKLVRLARVSRIYSRWESAITLTYGTQTMIRCFFRLILAAHWYACIFALQAAMHADPNNTWMGNEMYMTCHTLYPPPPSPTAPPPPPHRGTLPKDLRRLRQRLHKRPLDAALIVRCCQTTASIWELAWRNAFRGSASSLALAERTSIRHTDHMSRRL